MVANGATASPWFSPILVMKKMRVETNVAARDAIDTLVYDYIPGVSTLSIDGSSIPSLYSA